MRDDQSHSALLRAEMSETTFRILAIDDTEDIRELLLLRLSAEGYECHVAPDGPSGIALAEKIRPDLILLDMMMPGMDGYEVCRILKASPLTRRIPVIFLTARSDVTDRVQGLTLGAVDYVTKPFDALELRARVQVALRTKQAIESLEQANSELQRFSVTDDLTGLFNRRFFESRLVDELQNCERDGVTAACLLLDLDHFKQVNDNHGHLAGDAVIREFGRIIRMLTRRGDVVARFGGDEFAVLLAGVGPEAALAVAEKIRRAVAKAVFRVDGLELRLTVSAGVALLPLGSHTGAEGILAQADRALYRAKLVRNQVELVRESQTSEETRLESEELRTWPGASTRSS